MTNAIIKTALIIDVCVVIVGATNGAILLVIAGGIAGAIAILELGKNSHFEKRS